MQIYLRKILLTLIKKLITFIESIYYIADRILDEDRSAKYEMYNPGEFPKRGSIVSLVMTKIRSQNNLVGVILAQEQGKSYCRLIYKIDNHLCINT